MADQSILREYLVSLGFRVNKTEQRNMDSNVLKMDKRVMRLGGVAVTAAAAVVALTTTFAKGMEKMWYAARYAGTTVEAMQNLEYGARGIGLEGGKASQALKSMATALRSNPGLEGLLNSIGVQVKGRTIDQVFTDFIKATKNMPPYIAQQYAAMFGISPEDLFNYQQGIDKMQELMKAREQMARDMGVDTNEAAEASKQLMAQWRELEEKASLFGAAVAIAFQGPVKDLMGAGKELIDDWVKIIQSVSRAGSPSLWQGIQEGLMGTAMSERVKLTDGTQARLGDDYQGFRAPPGSSKIWQWREQAERWARRAVLGEKTGNYMDEKGIDAATDPSGWNKNPDMSEAERVRQMRERMGVKGGQAAPETGSGDLSARQAYLRSLEQKYGLPAGMLDRVWKTESARGTQMLSPAGAQGHFGFMPKTAKEYGLKDPNNFEESADASARKYRDLLKMYDGDPRQAAAAYNWGQGNLTQFHLGEKPMPKETQDYMDKVAGPITINQDTTINVDGSGDAKATARAVAEEQRTVNADVQRNLKPRMR
jgi:hypothetical protein